MSKDSAGRPSGDTSYFQELVQSNNEEDLEAAVRLQAVRIMKSLHIEEERFGEILETIEKDVSYRDIKDSWANLTPEERTLKGQEQTGNIIRTVYAARPYCMRCGECCSRVSPSLHPEDIDLFREGILRTSDVYTLRKGEPVLNNIKGGLDNLSQELVKLKESREYHYCIFYEDSEKSCRIYDRRPLQCRTQECWNPDGLEQLWSRDKLTRRRLLEGDPEILELIAVHEERCSIEMLDLAIKDYWQNGETSALDPVIDILSQDFIIRNFFIEKIGRHEQELDFLLGRPAAKIVEAYNLKVEKDENGTYHLIQNEQLRG